MQVSARQQGKGGVLESLLRRKFWHVGGYQDKGLMRPGQIVSCQKLLYCVLSLLWCVVNDFSIYSLLNPGEGPSRKRGRPRTSVAGAVLGQQITPGTELDCGSSGSSSASGIVLASSSEHGNLCCLFFYCHLCLCVSFFCWEFL